MTNSIHIRLKVHDFGSLTGHSMNYFGTPTAVHCRAYITCVQCYWRVALYTAERLCDRTFVSPICPFAYVNCGKTADSIWMPFGVVSGEEQATTSPCSHDLEVDSEGSRISDYPPPRLTDDL